MTTTRAARGFTSHSCLISTCLIPRMQNRECVVLLFSPPRLYLVDTFTHHKHTHHFSLTPSPLYKTKILWALDYIRYCQYICKHKWPKRRIPIGLEGSWGGPNISSLPKRLGTQEWVQIGGEIVNPVSQPWVFSSPRYPWWRWRWTPRGTKWETVGAQRRSSRGDCSRWRQTGANSGQVLV